MQDFISKESETSAFIEAKAVALIYCLIKKNDIFHLSEMRKQELHYPPPLCFAMQNTGEEPAGRRGWKIPAVEVTESGLLFLLLIVDVMGECPQGEGVKFFQAKYQILNVELADNFSKVRFYN